ncbi:MAG: 5-formyltetrahydrofolate cyclo-ligase [Candidatus Nanopelagicales bacterium]
MNDERPDESPGKPALRRALRDARRLAVTTASGSDPAQRSWAVCDAVLTDPLVAALLATAHRRPGPHRVALFVSIPGEPPTDGLRKRLAELGWQVWLPVARPARQLAWVADPGPSAAAWGLPRQPALPEAPEAGEVAQAGPAVPEFDLVILPALAATRDGRRLGQGGGYYDTWLATVPEHRAGGALRVAIVGPGELLVDVPTDPHDQPVDVVVVA